MMEIVFSDSAGGSLKLAQHYGEGNYKAAGCMGVIVFHADGSRPTKEEIAEAQRRAEEQDRAAWEKAVPMGGSPKDVYTVSLGLSVGDISDDDTMKSRLKEMQRLFSVYPDDVKDAAKEMTDSSLYNMKEVMRRLKAGDSLRVWYSSQPDELCGMYWLMYQLEKRGLETEEIYTVKLPVWETNRETNTIVRNNCWGDVAPEEWHRYGGLAEKAEGIFVKACALEWKKLMQENAPLRAEVNGRLTSVQESFYDEFIIKEIAAEADEFCEAVVIGRILGKYQLGIGDGWIALRIEKMIERGLLSAVTEAGEDAPSYHRVLQRRF